MQSEWKRLQSEFREIMDRTRGFPPHAVVTGVDDPSGRTNWTECKIAAGFRGWEVEKLHKLCAEAGALIPAGWQWPSTAFTRGLPPLRNQADAESRWILFVASVTPGYDDRIGNGSGPGFNISWAVSYEDGNPTGAHPFSGTIISFPAACELACDTAPSQFPTVPQSTNETDSDIGDQPRITVNARMMDTLSRKPESNGWSAAQWASHLDCSKSTVAETPAWESLKVVKAGAKIEKAKATDRRRKSSRTE